MTEQTVAGPVQLTTEDTQWHFEWSAIAEDKETAEYCCKLSSEIPRIPPKFSIQWSVSQLDMQFRWHPLSSFNSGGGYNIPPVWGSALSSDLASSAPVVLFGGADSCNRMLFAFSESLRCVKMTAGVHEESNTICCKAEFFTQEEPPMTAYELHLRLDLRSVFFADAVREAFAWLSAFPEYKAASVPAAAFEPLYSAWYSYHQNVHDFEMESECCKALEFGIKSLIVDDGWQTDDNNRGYGFCGDWEVSPRRFPDMAAHVKKVQELGIKYMIWYGISLIGKFSKHYTHFKGKYLYELERQKAAVLDPRFSEVREFLINILEKAVREWNLDGIKLDFIDCFKFRDGDPVQKEGMGERDIPSLPLAIDRLLSDIMHRLRALKPDILIEFRQAYLGPAIRKYGNMFRAADCPGDALSNRCRTIDLRLSSGNTAVHSDMIEWNLNDSPEAAALQILNVLFSVPQISLKLAELPESHAQMLRFWLDFWQEHKELLMNGELKPLAPDLHYPQISVCKDDEFLTAVYAVNSAVEISPASKIVWVVNASGKAGVYLNIPRQAAAAEMWNCCGEKQECTVPKPGINQIAIPRSGLLKIAF